MATAIFLVYPPEFLKEVNINLGIFQIKSETGPKYDSPLCSVQPDCPPSVEKKLTSNVNKALVIDYSDSRLISCGSVFQVREDIINHHLNEDTISSYKSVLASITKFDVT